MKWRTSPHVTRGILCCLAMCAAGVILGLGCQNPRREARSAIRNRQWDDLLTKFAETERGRPQQLEALRILHEELETRRSANLKRTLDDIEKSSRRRHQDWVEAQPLRRKELEAVMKGRPEDIDQFMDLLVK